MTLPTVMLSIMIGVALMITAGIGYAIVKLYQKHQQRQMHRAFDNWCDALDEAALNGDTREYDRIKSIGWRKFGVDAA